MCLCVATSLHRSSHAALFDHLADVLHKIVELADVGGLENANDGRDEHGNAEGEKDNVQVLPVLLQITVRLLLHDFDVQEIIIAGDNGRSQADFVVDGVVQCNA